MTIEKLTYAEMQSDKITNDKINEIIVALNALRINIAELSKPTKRGKKK